MLAEDLAVVLDIPQADRMVQEARLVEDTRKGCWERKKSPSRRQTLGIPGSYFRHLVHLYWSVASYGEGAKRKASSSLSTITSAAGGIQTNQRLLMREFVRGEEKRRRAFDWPEGRR